MPAATKHWSPWHQHAFLQIVTVIDCAFAFEQIGDGLNTVVVMRLSDRAGWHRQNVHTNLLRAHRFGGDARTDPRE